MNTAIQTKTHTAKSAKSKSLHNERKDKSIKNPDYIVLEKDNYHKFTQKEQIKAPKTTAKLQQQEKALKKELSTIQSKISTYSKRVQEYEAREKPNFAKIEDLKAKIKDLELQKEQIPKLSDNRGKPQKIKYVEFELSLTNSNHLKHDKSVQQAFIKSFNELKKDEIFKDLKSVGDVMHLDQHSLHIHSLNKLVNNKSWSSIVESQKQATDKDGRDVYSRLQNKFNRIVRQNMRELNLEIEPQQKGIKYLSLKRYKEKTNYKYKEQQQPQQPQQPKKENLFKKFGEIDKKNDDDFFSKLIEETVQQQKIANNLNINDILNGVKKDEKEVKNPPKNLDKLKENLVKAQERQQQLSAFEAQKKRLNEQFKETLKSNQNETQNEKEQKSNSKKHCRSR